MAKKIVKSDAREPVSVHDAMQEYLSSIKRLRPATQKEYRDGLTVFAAWCQAEKLLLSQIDQKEVDRFVEHLKTTRKPQKRGLTEISTYTLAGYVRVLLIFLNWCSGHKEYRHQVSFDTVRSIKKPKVIEKIIEAFTPEQIAALFKACDKEESEHLQVRDRAFIAVLLDTGIRANELVTLTLGHVHLGTKDPYIRILGKGNKWGEVGLGGRARRYLQDYIQTFRIPTIEYDIEQQSKTLSDQQGEILSDRQFQQMKSQAMQQSPAFVNRYGEALTVWGLYQTVKRLGQWAHIEGVRCSPHTFRHTFAKMFIEKNEGDIYKLSKLLRHSSVQVTENYLKSLKQSEARKGVQSVLDNL